MLFPGFRTEFLEVPNVESYQRLQKFPFRTKGKRKEDLVAFGSGEASELTYYENPRNRDFDEGIKDESQLTKWHPLTLQTIRYATSSEPVDITGSGFYDLIMTTDYGESFESLDQFGGRVCWLENFGTDEGDWTVRNVGRFPGINLVKIGNFSTTFSLQVLALIKSPDPGVKAPLIVFTRPADVYNAPGWHVTLDLEDTFTAIQDCIVVKGASGALDRLIISSQEGISLVWYSNRSWQYKNINCCTKLPAPKQLSAYKDGLDCLAGIVCSEANKGAALYLYQKRIGPGSNDLEDVEWDRHEIDDFSKRHSHAFISDFVCVDLDNDGVDEIIVSVAGAGQISGVYYYTLQNNQFVKYKISDKPVLQISSGVFAVKDRLDLATLSYGNPQKIMLHYQSFIHSEIRPSVRGPELIFYVSRSPSQACEVEVMEVAGFLFSLVVLPPNAFFDLAPDGDDAVKVLHGTLAWIDSRSTLIERTRASGLPGCTVPMLVDAPEGDVHSGNEGAVFIRMRPSTRTASADLSVKNSLPSHFPFEVREHGFEWKRHTGAMDEAQESVADIRHLPGFRVRFDDGHYKTPDIAYVHYWAARHGTSHTFSNKVQYLEGKASVGNAEKGAACSIRACLSNPGGDGGLLYLPDRLDCSTSPPTQFQLYRAKKMVLPVMHEYGPIWRATVDFATDSVKIDYPWHAWVNGGKTQKSRKRHIWVAFDFPSSSFGTEETSEEDKDGCIIC